MLRSLIQYGFWKMGRFVLAGLLASWLAVNCFAEAEPLRIGSLQALKDALSGDTPIYASVAIPGTVRWSSERDGRLIVSDSETTVQLQLDFPCQMSGQGDLLVIEGECLVSLNRDMIRLSRVPVVDADGIHAMVKKQGSVYLEKGFHPIQVSWFERTGSLGLEVSYAKPEGALEPIPDQNLYYLDDECDHVQGLTYRTFEGTWWNVLPNYDHLVPLNSGVVNGFDISVRSREHHVGVEFKGMLKVDEEGEYKFQLRSDDGSRLFIGESSIAIRVLKPAGDFQTLEMTDPDDDKEFQWLKTEGAVTSFHRSGGALEIEVMTRQGLVKVHVAQDSNSSYTLMLQNRIRVAGLSRTVRTLDRGRVRGEMFVQQWEDIEQLYVTPQIWAEFSPTTVGHLMSADPAAIMGRVVHLRGGVDVEETDDPLFLDDGTGKIILQGMGSERRAGSVSEVLGRVHVEESGLVLQGVYFRPLGEGGSASDHLAELTSAEQICQLSRSEAAKGYPVRVRGVITSIMDYEGVFEGVVIQDVTRGILVNTAGNTMPLEIGDYCEIEGNTSPYGFQPDILYTHIEKLGNSMLPDPIRPTWDQLINGTMHCNYVELEGVVTSIEDVTISLLTRDGTIKVRLNGEGTPVPRNSLGATVRLRGSLIADWDETSLQVLVGSIYLDQQKITVIKPAPIDPFAIPLKEMDDLLQFDPQAGALQRVKISGQLIYQDAQISYLMNGEDGLSFMSSEVHSHPLGSHLEVVGFVDLSGASPRLRYAVSQQVALPDTSLPHKLEPDAMVDEAYDSTMVQVTGELLGISRRPDETVFDMQSGMHRFVAAFRDERGLAELPEIGSTLELNGVYIGIGGNRVLGEPIDSFRILLNSADDFNVLSKPPWWTLKRLMLVVGVLLGAMGAALIWINLLHKQVEERTQQLGDQIRKRQQIERQRAIENERARLAHDLHDDLGSGLTEVNLLAVLASSLKTPPDERQQYTQEMNKLLTRMAVSLDEIVWAENPKNDSITSLAGYFGAHAQRLLGMASIGCGLEMADNLPEKPLDPKFRQELFLAFKEALNNVIKHAKAHKVWLRISVQDNFLVVTVADDGCGITPDEHDESGNGLVSMRSRMDALGGHCQIESNPGEGTTVSLLAPIRRNET